MIDCQCEERSIRDYPIIEITEDLMGIVSSKGDTNTPLLNLCKERNELIREARDARHHLAKSHLLYFQSLLDFGKALDQFVNKDVIVIPFSSDDDSSTSNLICCGSESDSDSDSDCLACDRSQTAPLSNNDDQNQREPVSGDGTSGASNIVEGLGLFESAPIKDEVSGSVNTTPIAQNNFFSGVDLFGLYDFADNTQCVFIEPDREIESDRLSEIRAREGIPDLESESDHNRKNQKIKKKNDVKERSSIAKVASGVDNNDTEANTCNDGQVACEADNSKYETCKQETINAPEIISEEVTRLDEEVCDEGAYESSSCSFSESSCSGLTDLRNVVGQIKFLCEKAVNYSEASTEFLEVSKVVHHQPLGSQFKGFASRVLGNSRNTTRSSLPKRGLCSDDLAGSLSMTLEKLYVWEKKLYAEVTAEEKLRISYEKGYKILKNLDQNGAESSEIYEAETAVKLQLSTINVSVRAVESISLRIHRIRDEELSFQVVEIINGFREMWRFLAKCHHKQFRVIVRSKSCVHIVEKRSSSRKAVQKVEEHIRRYTESLKGYIDAQRRFVRLLNEWLNRNIMENDENKTEAPEIFNLCSKWLREIENLNEIKVLCAVEETRLRFRGLWLKQAEEEKQRMRTERLCKELEKKTKEVEEILGTALVFPAIRSAPSAEMMVESELLSLRECVTLEKEKHEKMIRELNDTVSMCLQESLVPVFEGLKDFCLGNFKAYQNIRVVSLHLLS